MNQAELILPIEILHKAKKSGNEYGWSQADFPEVIEAARQKSLAIIGGQVQYVVPGATCELYWLSYDPADRKSDESWTSYCIRTAGECLNKFNLLLTRDIESEAISSFTLLREKKNAGEDISKYQTFILYFAAESEA